MRARWFDFIAVQTYNLICSTPALDYFMFAAKHSFITHPLFRWIHASIFGLFLLTRLTRPRFIKSWTAHCWRSFSGFSYALFSLGNENKYLPNGRDIFIGFVGFSHRIHVHQHRTRAYNNSAIFQVLRYSLNN